MIKLKVGAYTLWQKLRTHMASLRISSMRQRRRDRRARSARHHEHRQSAPAIVETLETRVVLTAPGGAVDFVLPNGTIQGWSFDPDTKNVADAVDLYVDNTFCSRTVTSVSRPDVSGKFGLSINPGFLLTIPPKYENGATHTYTVYAIDTAGAPNPNPSIGTGTFNLQAPVGAVDSVNSNGTISGWSFDPDVKNIANSVDLYVDGNFCSRTQTSVYRPDVSNKFGLSINTGFTINIPSQYFDSRQHTYAVYAIEGSPGSNLPNPQFATGHFTLAPPQITIQPPILDDINGSIAYSSSTQVFNYRVILDGGATYTSPLYATDSSGNFSYGAPPLRTDGSTSQLQIMAIDPNNGLVTTSAAVNFKWPFTNTPATSSVNPVYFSSVPTNTNFITGTPTYGGVYYYHEWSNRVLQGNLTLDVGAPGDYIGKGTQYPSMQSLLPGSPYPAYAMVYAGTAIDSYYVHSKPPAGVLTYSSGTLWFPNRVIGLITEGADLHASESTSLLGRSDVTYSDGGLEIYVPTGGSLDSVRVLSDGHTVQFAFRASGVDDFRVITQTDPPPPPPPTIQPPRLQTTNFSLADNAPNGSTVGTVTASDSNAGATMSFAITGGNSAGAFAISSGGVITVADSTNLNYASNPVFNLTVVVTDSYGLTDSNTVTINLTHVKAPSNIVLSNSSITEGLVAGTSVGQFANPDLPGVAVQYTLVAGSGGDDNSSFTIDSSGVLRSTASFDYDVKNGYSIRVRATDQWGLTYDKVFTISVIDVFEAPVMTAQSFSIPDNLPNGSVVGTITASVDAGDTVAFSIAGGNSLGAFSVTSAGVITVADSTKLSFLLNPVVKLTISATDSLNLASTSTVTINLTEAKPPALAGIEGTTLIYVGATPVVVSTSITANAPDSLTLNSAVIQIANGYQNGSDSLKFTNTSTISGTWNSSTGTLTLNCSDTVANYQAALRSISFQNTGTNTSARTISFQVSDGFLSSNSISRLVDAPPNVLSLVTAGSNPTSGPAIQYTVTFSEAVTGVSSANFSLVETGWVSATGIQVAAVSPSVYTITVNGVTGTGTLGVNLTNPSNVFDAGNNPLQGKYSGQIVTVDTKPVVTLQPTNFSVAAGGAASFTAAATGFPLPDIQWQVSTNNGSTWGNIFGATSATYSFVTATTDNGSEYRAVFTNAVGVATSSVATLTVTQAPVATVYWTGLGDGHSWSNASNWSTKSIPGANDNVLINAASGTIIHGPTAVTTVRNLTITSANFFVDGAFLTVTNGVVVANGQSLTVGNYSSLIPGSISLNAASLTLSQNGIIKGGTVTETGAANIAVVGSGVLDGTTVSGNVTVTHANNDSLFLRNTVTLNGTLLIGATDGSTWATVFFNDAAAGAVTLTGNASVIFGGNTTNGINFYDNGGAITLGSNVILHGNNGRVVNTFYTGTVIFQGTVAADVAGGTISFASSTVVDQNTGTLTASNGGTLALNNTWTNTGTVTSTGTGNVLLAGIVNNGAGTINLDGSLTLQQNGTVKGGTINETTNGIVTVIGTGILDGTTVNGNVSVTHANGDYLVLRNTVTLNGTLLIGATDGSTLATLFFRDDAGGAVTLAGNASVVFGGNTTNGINFYDNGGTITLGSNVTLHGKNGRVVDTFYTGTVLFQGTVAADVAGGTISFASSTVAYQNSGILTANNGGTLSLGNTWKNTGKITSTSGGNLLLLGAVDNSQGTFAIDSLMTMQGGQGSAITGGTVTETVNGNISVITAAILDNVTVNGNISLTHGTGEYLILRDTVTLNGNLFIGAADGSTSEVVYLGYGSSNPVTLAGYAALVFGGGTSNTIDNFVATGTTTLASTVTIRGKTGSLINNYATGAILDQGTISADVSGGTITAGNYAGTYQNTGTFKASNGGVLVVSGTGITNSLAGLIESPTGTIQFGSNLLTTATNMSLFDPEGNVTFNLNANVASAKLLEATSLDLGNIAAGFVGNSAFGSLNLTNATYVKLVNQAHNTVSSMPEAVYVNSLNVAANTTLDLNGLHLYALNASIKGAILNGTINAIGVAPAITTQPSSTTVLPLTTASFTAAASGTLTPTVQWQVSTNSGTTWTNIVGSTSTTYSFTTASGNNGSQYRAVFTNPSGTATTNAATLTVATANVTSSSVRWGTSGSATLQDASGGRLLPTGRINDIGWFNINSGTVTLDRSIPSLSPADISVIGSVGGNYGPVTVSGSGTTWVITLAKVIADAEKLIVTIGNAQLTSYQRELDILPGDFNDDAVVDSSDVTLLNNSTVAPYSVFADLNGDGLVDINDGKLARTKIGTKRIL